MPNSLLTSVSGLLAHQRRLDIVANNLANLNTTAFKSTRGVFADMFYETINPATSGNSSTVGGTNSNQIGTGVTASQLNKKFTQGNLEATGQPFDFAVSGEGFFVVSDGNGSVFTRAGSFSLDESGFLVDPATGYRVQRYGDAGEGDNINPAFQDPNSPNIVVPLGTAIPGQATQALSLAGNLNSVVSGPAAEVMTSSNPMESSGVAATLSTLLNDLDSSTAPYVGGDSVVINGLNSDGSNFSTTLSVDGTTTVGDLINAINGVTLDSTASLDPDGNLLLTADTVGEAFLSLTIEDTTGNSGNVDFVNHWMLQTTEGTEGQTFEGAFDVFDSQGGAHSLTYTFQKVSDNTWDLTFSLPPSEGTLTNNTVTGIVFNDEGEINLTGLAATMTAQFTGLGGSQDLAISINNLTQYATEFQMESEQDGFAPSKLVSVRTNADGLIQGITTNGQRFPVAQIALATFSNVQGLSALGNNYFEDSLNSGLPQIGAATFAGRGSIIGRQLEGSNVDVALEFTQLIVAQRGFSANARSISVASEILEELTNIVR